MIWQMFRIIELTGGLGNQIFEYAVYLYLKRKYPDDRLYVYYTAHSFSEHNGYLEVTRHFDAEMPQPRPWLRYARALMLRITRLTGYRRWETTWDGPVIKDESYLFLYAYRNNRRYIPLERDWIRFKRPVLSQQNVDVLGRITSGSSVFVHVRRGDYLSAKYRDRFWGICTMEYYQKAMRLMRERHPGARFFVFSDDTAWCRNHITSTDNDMEYIDWNTGYDSYLDMYLMAHCKAGIMANSTFSYWAARLVRQKDVIYPVQWSRSQYGVPDIFEPDWIGI